MRALVLATLVGLLAAGCCSTRPACCATRMPRRASVGPTSRAAAPAAVPADVVVDPEEDQRAAEEQWLPVIGTWPREGSTFPEHGLQRAFDLLFAHDIPTGGGCDLGWCWVTVPETDVVHAVQVLKTDPALAPFARIPVEELEGLDSRVLRSKTRAVPDRAAGTLREHGIKAMVEEDEGLFEVWVESVHRNAAIAILRAAPSLAAYVSKTPSSRDIERRVDGWDARVLFSTTRDVSDHAAAVLRAGGIEAMVEPVEGIVEVWVARAHDKAALALLLGEPALAPYVTEVTTARPVEERPGRASAGAR